VEAEIRPEPDSEERAVILSALDAERGSNALPAAYRSRWRELAIRESSDEAEDEAEEPPYSETGRPRSSPGASRA
jgi:hypothetical protein